MKDDEPCPWCLLGDDHPDWEQNELSEPFEPTPPPFEVALYQPSTGLELGRWPVYQNVPPGDSVEMTVTFKVTVN